VHQVPDLRSGRGVVGAPGEVGLGLPDHYRHLTGTGNGGGGSCARADDIINRLADYQAIGRDQPQPPGVARYDATPACQLER